MPVFKLLSEGIEGAHFKFIFRQNGQLLLIIIGICMQLSYIPHEPSETPGKVGIPGMVGMVCMFGIVYLLVINEIFGIFGIKGMS